MADNLPHDNRGFVEHWRKVAPVLERIRREELRNFDHQANTALIDALLQLGVDFGKKRTASGLVELARRLRGSRP